MAGHSHWARIKRKKAVVDAKRGAAWSKVAKAITVAARMGGGDPGMNLSLRYALDKARVANMPKDNIERAIKKGTGALEGANQFEQLIYEAYAPGGVAIMVDILTDNRNRTAGEIRKILEKGGGSLAAANAVARMFDRMGVIEIDPATAGEERVMEVALEAGAENVETSDDTIEVTCRPDGFDTVTKAFEAAGITPRSAEVKMLPNIQVPVADPEAAQRLMNLLQALEDHDDVSEVYSNVDIPDEVAEKLEG
jgi:YebC/PmpR family DNA-binding regulatory protein